MVAPRRAQESHTHNVGSIATVDSTIMYAIPALTNAGTPQGNLVSTPSGGPLNLPTPTSGGSDFASRIRNGRTVNATYNPAGFPSGHPTDARMFTTLRGWASVQRIGVSSFSSGNRFLCGMQTGTGVITGDPPPAGFLGIWQTAAGSTIQIGSSTASVDTGFTLQNDSEYVVTTSYVAGESDALITMACENGDSYSYPVTLTVTHTGARFMLTSGVSLGTGTQPVEAWFIYYGAVQPD